jgi:IS5 family transposase
MQNSLFDLENRYASLSEAGDPLERLNAVIDWKMFRSLLERIDQKPRKSAAGRKPTCRILMFKMLILQRLHHLSDDRLQYQVTDRLSFMRFLGLDLAADVPDAKTVWAFREALKTHRLVEPLFELLNLALAQLGVAMKSGQIIDASFVPVPIQRNTREENAKIKENEVPAEWEDSPSKLAQKDVHARWAKKGGKTYYGYKNHINVDRQTKLITKQACSDASVHDSQVFDAILRKPKEGGASVWADSAYRSADQERVLKAKRYQSQIHEKGHRNYRLSDEQKRSNKKKSKVRARVEHVFGAMRNEMGGLFVRTIGMARAEVNIGLMNLAYNMKRIETLIRRGFFTFNRVIAPSDQKTA